MKTSVFFYARTWGKKSLCPSKSKRSSHQVRRPTWMKWRPQQKMKWTRVCKKLVQRRACKMRVEALTRMCSLMAMKSPRKAPPGKKQRSCLCDQLQSSQQDQSNRRKTTQTNMKSRRSRTTNLKSRRSWTTTTPWTRGSKTL